MLKTKLKHAVFALSAALMMQTATAEVVEVQILKKQFIPEHVTINVGDTVRWVNIEKRQYHNVWFKALGEPEGDYFFPGESVERVFDQAGEFPYECGPHPKMTGSVTVVSGSSDTEKKTLQKASESSIDQARADELDYLVKQDCGSCHGMLLKGGLGPALLPENIKAYSIEDLVAVIRYGRPGTPMPPWKDILSENDAEWIATRLKAGELAGQSQNKGSHK